MIVTCENCSSRFVVDPKVLEPRGRRVRCARCKSVWFQAPPSANDLSGDADMRPSTDGVERRQVFRRDPAAASAAQNAAPKAPTSEPETQAADEIAAPTAQNESPDTDANSAAAMEPEQGDGAPQDAQSAETVANDLPDLPWGAQARGRKKAQVPALYSRKSPLLLVAGYIALAALLIGGLGGAVLARETIAEKLPGTKPVYAAIGFEMEREVVTANVEQYLRLETPPPAPAYWRDDKLIQEITGTITNTHNAPVKIPALEGILRDRNNNELFRWLFSAETDVLLPGQRTAFATEIIDLPQEAAEMELVFADGDAPRKARETASKDDSYARSR